MIEWILYGLAMTVAILTFVVVRQAMRLTVLEARHEILTQTIESALQVAIESVAELRQQVNREMNHLRHEVKDEKDDNAPSPLRDHPTGRSS